MIDVHRPEVHTLLPGGLRNRTPIESCAALGNDVHTRNHVVLLCELLHLARTLKRLLYRQRQLQRSPESICQLQAKLHKVVKLGLVDRPAGLRKLDRKCEIAVLCVIGVAFQNGPLADKITQSAELPRFFQDVLVLSVNSQSPVTHHRAGSWKIADQINMRVRPKLMLRREQAVEVRRPPLLR